MAKKSGEVYGQVKCNYFQILRTLNINDASFLKASMLLNVCKYLKAVNVEPRARLS